MYESFTLITVVGVIFIIALLSSFITYILYAYQKKQNIHFSEMEKMKTLMQAEVLKVKLEMQEEAMQHVSREIHDSVGQQFILGLVHLNDIVHDFDEINAEKIAKAIDIFSGAVDDLRDITKGLSLEIIRNYGLVFGIEWQMAQLRKTKRFSLDFLKKGTYVPLGEQRELFLLRILQEALTNVMKHARAKTVVVELTFYPALICLTIKDDGQGFFVGGPVSPEGTFVLGSGIYHMKTRAELIKADFAIHSQPGEGTQIMITVPH